MEACGAAQIKRRYGVTFQHGALFSSLTVAENVTLPVAEAMDLEERRATRHSSSCGCGWSVWRSMRRRSIPAQLSGGMVKRVALARALALDPVMLFLDEPTAGLDPIAAGAFDELVLYLRRTLKLTIVMVTHDLDTLARTCDRVAVLVDGKVIVDTRDRIMDNEHPWIREYFHGPRGRREAAGGARVGA